MKKEISLLLLLVYFSSKFQTTMARHSHHSMMRANDCRRCAPGFGVSRPCSRHRDTRCEVCVPGSYSSHSSAHLKCLPCSRCGLGLYIAHACTASRDTVCDSCHTYRGPHNRNYYERCGRRNRTLIKERIEQRVPTSAVNFSGVVITLLAIALIATSCVVTSRRSCKKVDHRYEAVATQEAVML